MKTQLITKALIAASSAFFLVTLGSQTSHGLSGGPILGDGCWRYSSPDSAQCPVGQNCVEWDIEGFNIATDCCDTGSWGTGPNCVPGCVESELDRPLFTIEPSDMATKDMQAAAFEIRHPVPKIPLSIDHVLYLPEEIARFEGVPLHFLMCRATVEESVLYAFTSRQILIDQAKNCQIGKSTFIVPGIPRNATRGVAFYDSEQWDGPSYFLAGGSQLDLSDSWWNGRISSLRGVGNGTLVTFFENSNRTGSSLTLSTDLGWKHLAALGWDNRASAVMVWPVKNPTSLPSTVLLDDLVN